MSQGTVKWYSNESGYGFVRPDDGGQNILVRRVYMVGGGLKPLKKGDRVTCDMTQSAKGLWATNVSKEEQRCYSWRDDCLEQHEGKEVRYEYYARLEEGEEA